MTSAIPDSFPAEKSPLGQHAEYPQQYDPTLLFPMARQDKRNELGIAGTIPFFGVDIWNAYEVSWLNMRGKPQIAIATLTVPADSSNIVESKSLKLYLNSFNQARLGGPEALTELLRLDLSNAFGTSVHVVLKLPDSFSKLSMNELDGMLLDRLDIEVDDYTYQPSLLKANHDEGPVEEILVSHLLKSNCLVTGQPDWGSVQIRYVGSAIDQEGLLKYIIGFRKHNEFHEHCVERMFMDILRQCKPQKLAVHARYTRRGGIDINPWRSNFTSGARPMNSRSARQ